MTYPEDVLKAAERVTALFRPVLTSREAERLRDDIAWEIMAERQRCAAIARSTEAYDDRLQQASGFLTTGQRIARAISPAAPEPSEAKRVTAIEDRALLEMRRYTTNGAPCSLPWGSEDMT